MEINHLRSCSLGDEARPDIRSIKNPVGTADVSALGRQLSDSALRAAQRDSELSRDELAAYAKKQKHAFLLDGYKNGKYRHDLERPDSDDPERVERARQATEYVNRSANGDEHAKNPFSGLSLDQLVLIAYDDSASFTINERRAAWSGSSRLEYQWERGAVARSQLESSSTGKVPVFLTEVLNHYKALPLIEQVQDRFPENYVAHMEAKIQAESALPAGKRRKPAERGLNLYDILAQLSDPIKKTSEAKKASSDEKSLARTSALLISSAHADGVYSLKTNN